MKAINKIFLFVLLSSFAFGQYYYSYGKKIQLTPIAPVDIQRNNIDLDIIYYTKGRNSVGVNGNIIIKFNKGAKKEDILKKFDLINMETISTALWLVKTKHISQTLDISNKLYKLKDVQYAHPDFLQKIERRSVTTPKDPLFKKSWHLKKNDLDGTNPAFNISQVFQITKGDGVKIGMIDDGLDVLHKDLGENIGAYVNVNNVNASPSLYLFEEENHGTQMGGIIVSDENNIGGVGIAPMAKIYFAKHNNTLRDTTKISDFLRGFKWLRKQKVKVISNSWGTYDVEESLADYINDTKKQGIVIVFASGNNSYSLDDNQYNDESELDSVLGIGSVDNDGEDFAYYSNYGKNVDFLTVGNDIQTTNLDNEYVKTSGTSASAAIVSAVIGLMFSIHPDLSFSEVKDILKQSSTISINKDGRSYPVLNMHNTLQVTLSMQSLEDVANQLLENPTKNIDGEFAFYDFSDSPVHLDWIYIKNNTQYRLMGQEVNNDNKFGFKKISNISNLKSNFYLINRFGLDTLASSHWILSSKDGSLVYLLKLQDKTMKYEKLKLKATIDLANKKLKFIKN